ncbi:MAG: hypothetical protein IPM98_20300 [Lewinellaceae bacterium]|nr:hypothetical protein [Lewinellaceae bacterium]
MALPVINPSTSEGLLSVRIISGGFGGHRCRNDSDTPVGLRQGQRVIYAVAPVMATYSPTGLQVFHDFDFLVG